MEFLKKQHTFFPSEIHVENITNTLTELALDVENKEILKVTPENATDEITLSYNGENSQYIHINKINNREFTIFIDQQFYFVATGNVTLVASANNKNYEFTYTLSV